MKRKHVDAHTASDNNIPHAMRGKVSKTSGSATQTKKPKPSLHAAKALRVAESEVFCYLVIQTLDLSIFSFRNPSYTTKAVVTRVNNLQSTASGQKPRQSLLVMEPNLTSPKRIPSLQVFIKRHSRKSNIRFSSLIRSQTR
jgi:hypothetical protein